MLILVAAHCWHAGPAPFAPFTFAVLACIVGYQAAQEMA